jgi:hypothetical protein
MTDDALLFRPARMIIGGRKGPGGLRQMQNPVTAANVIIQEVNDRLPEVIQYAPVLVDCCPVVRPLPNGGRSWTNCRGIRRPVKIEN